MRDLHNNFIGSTFLRSVLGHDYEAFKDSDEEKALEDRLAKWASRTDLKETSAEAAFIEQFFRQTWGYHQSGQQDKGETWHAYPRYTVKGAGQKGGPGEADLALGYFIKDGESDVPQVLCEFKDIKSALDAPQKSRKDGLSPVAQCLNYLSKARREVAPGEPVVPHWGIVTDMNEFRLYWHDRGKQQYLRFHVRREDFFSDGMVNIDGSCPDDEDSRFERFLFWKLFHRETLTTSVGKPRLVQLIERQWVKEREIEREFYEEYRALRETLIDTIIENNPIEKEEKEKPKNPPYTGTKGGLVRLAQKILDRCIFIFFCEDMGAALNYPPQLLRDFLIERSRDTYFEPEGNNIWRDLIRLFKAMNVGSAFGPHNINQFNGGLFAEDKELEALSIPNKIFCQHGQGANEASLFSYKKTFLYLSASYNYAGGWAEGLTKTPIGDAAKDSANRVKADPNQSLGLYMLGRIFEQSITELEILEAKYEGRLSVNELSKRKRDGVYYTPEWVVERIVQETIGPIFERFKKEAGWPPKKNPNEAQIATYGEKLKGLTVLDPACGSGAFLITTLRFLLDESKALQSLRYEVTEKAPNRDDDELVRDILQSNIYGVDINAASVEIARLALWLHTARGNKPLSSLEGTIKEGNSLINSDFYKGQIDLSLYDEEEKERINAFDWEQAFPDVFASGGFDAVVGNPPYVKLQNFRKVHEDMALFLKEGRKEVDEVAGYESAQTGNFDLYLPFIEKGLDLLNDQGRLGYIAPSVWVMNEYGKALRALIAKGQNLHRWLDFKSHQIFNEATVYTALQFFSKEKNKAVEIAYAPDGSVPEEPWADTDCALKYSKIDFGDRWLLITGKQRSLLSKLFAGNMRLADHDGLGIHVGIQTSANNIFHLTPVSGSKFESYPEGPKGQSYEVEIEPDLIRPLVSGPETKRYRVPITNTALLLPYSVWQDGRAIISPKTMKSKYPLAWRYFTQHENFLRARESAKMDDDENWFGYNYPKNIEKQNKPKVLIASTATELVASYDVNGDFATDDRRVYSLVWDDADALWYLLGILNSPCSSYAIKRLCRPKANGFMDIEKQFLSDLPIPKAKPQQQTDVATRAKELQVAHTAFRDKIAALSRRTSDMPSRSRPESFLFPSVTSAKDRAEDAPKSLEQSERRDWAKEEYKRDMQDRLDAINQRLTPEAKLEAVLKDGELTFVVDGFEAINRVYVDEEEAELIAAQWKAIASTFTVSGKDPAKRLCGVLRKLVVTTNAAQIKQIIKLQREIADLEASIAKQEVEMNALTYQLYKLTDEEIKMVERG